MTDRLVAAAGWLVVAFLLAPLVVVIGGSVTETPFVRFPPEGVTARWYAQLAGRRDFIESFFDSLAIALACTALATFLGTLAAIALHRDDLRGRSLLRLFVMSPLVLPTVITGVALLQFYNLIALDQPFLGIVIGHVLITVPYVLRTVGAGLIGMEPQIEEAAESLGAGALRVLLKVTLPAIAPSVFVSTVFVFIVSFDQVTVSIFLAGAELMPLPIRIYSYIEFAIDPMVAAASTVLIVFAYLVVVLLERAFGLDRAFGGGTGR